MIKNLLLNSKEPQEEELATKPIPRPSNLTQLMDRSQNHLGSTDNLLILKESLGGNGNQIEITTNGHEELSKEMIIPRYKEEFHKETIGSLGSNIEFTSEQNPEHPIIRRIDSGYFDEKREFYEKIFIPLQSAPGEEEKRLEQRMVYKMPGGVEKWNDITRAYEYGKEYSNILQLYKDNFEEIILHTLVNRQENPGMAGLRELEEIKRNPIPLYVVILGIGSQGLIEKWLIENLAKRDEIKQMRVVIVDGSKDMLESAITKNFEFKNMIDGHPNRNKIEQIIPVHANFENLIRKRKNLKGTNIIQLYRESQYLQYNRGRALFISTDNTSNNFDDNVFMGEIIAGNCYGEDRFLGDNFLDNDDKALYERQVQLYNNPAWISFVEGPFLEAGLKPNQIKTKVEIETGTHNGEKGVSIIKFKTTILEEVPIAYGDNEQNTVEQEITVYYSKRSNLIDTTRRLYKNGLTVSEAFPNQERTSAIFVAKAIENLAA